jgi:broad specificity phosphatase PhoE
MKIALIRHGRTEWNAQHRVQGRIETHLSAEGRAEMERLRPPPEFVHVRAYCSPQTRARETAALLGLADPILDERLREQNWGSWEGLTKADMIARDGEDCFVRAGFGMDFRPPGGEATRELAARVKDFLFDAAHSSGDAVAVAHMGVLRTAFALATGWDMFSTMPADLDLKAALILRIEADTVAVAQLNAPLGRR